MYKRISVEQFYKYGKRIEIEAGDTVYNADAAKNKQYAYFLDKGICALSRMTREGEERVYLYFRGKKTIGFTQYLPITPSKGGNFRISAKTDCVLYRISKEKFEELLENDKEFEHFIMEVLAKNYQELLARYHQAQDMSIPERIANLMLEYKVEKDGKWYLPSFFSHAEIASYLGTHVVTVSRIMARMKKMGYIATEGRLVVIANPERLERLLNGEEELEY